MRSFHTSVAVIAAAGVLVGCDYRNQQSSTRSEPVVGGHTSSLAAQPAQIVNMTDMRFDPETIRIRVGEVVEWRNTSNMPHTATLDPARAMDPYNIAMPMGAGTFHSGRLSSGDTYRHRFEVPGRYRYVCTLHEAQGMTGEIIVEGP